MNRVKRLAHVWVRRLGSCARGASVWAGQAKELQMRTGRRPLTIGRSSTIASDRAPHRSTLRSACCQGRRAVQRDYASAGVEIGRRNMGLRHGAVAIRPAKVRVEVNVVDAGKRLRSSGCPPSRGWISIHMRFGGRPARIGPNGLALAATRTDLPRTDLPGWATCRPARSSWLRGPRSAAVDDPSPKTQPRPSRHSLPH